MSTETPLLPMATPPRTKQITVEIAQMAPIEDRRID
jgi:hypothetical protein